MTSIGDYRKEMRAVEGWEEAAALISEAPWTPPTQNLEPYFYIHQILLNVHIWGSIADNITLLTHRNRNVQPNYQTASFWQLEVGYFVHPYIYRQSSLKESELMILTYKHAYYSCWDIMI